MGEAGRFMRIMKAQMAKAVKEDHPHLLFHMDEQDCRVWHVLVANLQDPYEGGEYIFRLEMDEKFPQRPPKFEALTPNGLYEPGGEICISIGRFHATDTGGAHGESGWRAAMGLIGFCREIVNGLVTDTVESGIRIAPSPPRVRRERAAASRSFNRQRYPSLVRSFEEYAESNPDLIAVKLRRMWNCADNLTRVPRPEQVTDPHSGLLQTLKDASGMDAETCQGLCLGNEDAEVLETLQLRDLGKDWPYRRHCLLLLGGKSVADLAESLRELLGSYAPELLEEAPSSMVRNLLRLLLRGKYEAARALVRQMDA